MALYLWQLSGLPLTQRHWVAAASRLWIGARDALFPSAFWASSTNPHSSPAFDAAAAVRESAALSLQDATAAVKRHSPPFLWQQQQQQRRGYRAAATFARTDSTAPLEERRRAHLRLNTVSAEQAVQVRCQAVQGYR